MRTPQTSGEWDLYMATLPAIHRIEDVDENEIYSYYQDEEGKHFLDKNMREYRILKNGKYTEVEN